MKFTKMHGIGNDYIYLNCLKGEPKDPGALSKRLSDRHFGIGSDGLVLICPSDQADFQMKMFNSDGSQAEMCGNAIRCVGKYCFDKGLTQKNLLTIETLAGIKRLDMTVTNGRVEQVTVDMGEPVLTPSDIPVALPGDRAVRAPITVEGKQYHITCVSMGNPHAVLFLEQDVNLKGLDLADIGPKFECHSLFPRHTNTEFAKVLDRTTIEMRVWERGAGETLACGTGACATHVAAVLCGLCDRQTTLKLLGGDLTICWDEDSNHVFMTGPACFSFEGYTED